MHFLWAFFFANFAFADTSLVVQEVDYSPAARDVSCGLLHQRELERAKVLRELRDLSADERRIALTNNLLTDKLFLPSELWRDQTVSVHMRVQVPDDLAAHIAARGLAQTFLITDGPGFIWQSYATQRPSDFALAYDATAHLLELEYPVFQNVYCLDQLWTPRVTWIPDVNAEPSLSQ